MNYKDTTDFFHHLEQISRLALYSFEKNTMIYPSSDSFCTTSVLHNDSELLHSLLAYEGVYFEPEFDIFYVVHYFTDSFCCILGPLSLHSAFPSVQQRYSVRHSLPDKFASPIKRTSRSQITSIMSMIEYHLKQLAFPCISSFLLPENILSSNFHEANGFSIPNHQADEFHDPFYKPSHGTYLLETRINNALLSGNEKELFHLLSESDELYSSAFAINAAKHAEYSAVMLIVQFTRTAIDIGIPEPEAYALSDALLYETSCKKNISEYQDIFYKACKQYLQLIRHYTSTQSNIPLLNQCKSYIYQHLNQPLSVDSIAAALNVSRDYLLHLFSEHEHITLMEFVRTKRIDSIKNMLKYSDYDLLRIATYYNFKTQSHFSATFKKYVGMSPSTYRKLHKPDSF